MNRGPGDRATTEHDYVEERLSAYLDGVLSAREQRIVDHHLARCPACRWNLRTLRQTVQWTRELSMVPVPRAFTLPTTVRARPAPRPRRSFLPLLQGATVLVALLLVFVVAGDVWLLGLLPASAPRPVAAPEQPAAQVEVSRGTALQKEAAPAPLAEAKREVEATAAPSPPVSVETESGGQVVARVPVESPPSSRTQETQPEGQPAEPPSLTLSITEKVFGLGGAVSETQPVESPEMAWGVLVTEPLTMPMLDMAMARRWITETALLTLPLSAEASSMASPFTAPIPGIQEPIPGTETRESPVTPIPAIPSPTMVVEALAVAPSPTMVVEALAVGPSPTIEIKAMPTDRPSLASPAQPTATPTLVEAKPPAPTTGAAAPQPVLPTPMVQGQEPAPAGEDSERMTWALERTTLMGWLRIAEIGLGTLFVVLAMTTLVLMIGRRQTQ